MASALYPYPGVGSSKSLWATPFSTISTMRLRAVSSGTSRGCSSSVIFQFLLICQPEKKRVDAAQRIERLQKLRPDDSRFFIRRTGPLASHKIVIIYRSHYRPLLIQGTYPIVIRSRPGAESNSFRANNATSSSAKIQTIGLPSLAASCLAACSIKSSSTTPGRSFVSFAYPSPLNSNNMPFAFLQSSKETSSPFSAGVRQIIGKTAWRGSVGWRIDKQL